MVSRMRPARALSRNSFSRSWDLWLLPAVLLTAGILRFHALSQRGLVYWDEAKFALEGLRLLAGTQAALGAHISPLAGKAIGTAKPTHALLIALSYAVLGTQDRAPLFLDAVCSCLEIVVLYLLGRRFFGPVVALLAALFLAVSRYDIIYAPS